MFATGVSLKVHPDTPAKAVAGVFCSLIWQDIGHWSASFTVDAPPEALRLPPSARRARVDGLWQRTCFELFILDDEDESYMEFNFSPSGEWAAYAFDGRRTGMRRLEVKAPAITSSNPVQFKSGMGSHLADIGLDEESIKMLLDAKSEEAPPEPARYVLVADLEDDKFAPRGVWWMGISAVIEEADGTKSYWSLAHGEGPPDFHNPGCFGLELPAPAAS